MHGRFKPEFSKVQSSCIILVNVVSSFVQGCYSRLLLFILCFGISVALRVYLSLFFVRYLNIL